MRDLWRILAAFVLMALGFLVVIQARAGRSLGTQPEVPTRNIYAMATLLREEREARAELEKEVARLRLDLEAYQRAASEGQSVTAVMSAELERLRLALGLKAMEGPGVTVAMRDAATRPAGANPAVVTYQDIVGVVNELWAAGAEVVAVNAQRVSATTGFGQVGGTVVVNLQRLTAPFVISALGDPATLEGALAIRGGLVDAMKAIGLNIAVTRHARLVVPASSGPGPFEHARPVK